MKFVYLPSTSLSVNRISPETHKPYGECGVEEEDDDKSDCGLTVSEPCYLAYIVYSDFFNTAI